MVQQQKVILDPYLEDSVKVLEIQMQTSTLPIVGLIIGHYLENGGYIIVLLPKIPQPVSVIGDMQVINCDDFVSDSISFGKPKKAIPSLRQKQNNRAIDFTECIDEEWIGLHGEQVLRGLPGGLVILGLYVCCNQKVRLSLQTLFIKSLRQLYSVQRRVFSRLLFSEKFRDDFSSFLGFNEMILLHVDLDAKLQANLIDFSDGRPVVNGSIPVSYHAFNWHTIRTSVIIDQPVLGLLEGTGPLIGRCDEPTVFEKRLLDGIAPFCSKIWESVGTFNGQYKDLDCPLVPKQTGGRKKTNISDKQSIQLDWYCDLYTKLQLKKDSTNNENNDTIVFNTDAVMCLRGSMQCCAYVPQVSNAAEALNAIKQDIIRSLYTRVQLHCQGMQVLEGETEDPRALHQFPRRVFVSFKGPTQLSICDYLFEGDSIEDSSNSLSEIFDVPSIDKASFQTQLERFPELEELEQIGLCLPLENGEIQKNVMWPEGRSSGSPILSRRQSVPASISNKSWLKFATYPKNIWLIACIVIAIFAVLLTLFAKM